MGAFETILNTNFNYPTAGELFSPTIATTGKPNSSSKLWIGMGIGIVIGGITIYFIMKSNHDQILKTMLVKIEEEKKNQSLKDSGSEIISEQTN